MSRTAPHWTSSVLQSVAPVAEGSTHVSTNPDAIEQVAGWMAYEEFQLPGTVSSGPFALPTDSGDAIDLTMLITSLNFAFTDFDTGVKFTAERHDRTWVDSEGMFACLHRARENGIPILEGSWLAEVTRDELAEVFTGNIEMPMLDERAEMLNTIGRVLVEQYGGRFHNWARDCAPAMYADGDGLLERMVGEFPRFDDVSDYHGQRVELFKLAQLGLWALHSAQLVNLRDLDRMTAFADYIVPVAMRVMGIFRYDEGLERRINEGEEIPRDSDEEIEIRAHTLYATALLTDAINERRPDELRLVIPQVDYRLWKTYHATFWPHHLTRTIMY